MSVAQASKANGRLNKSNQIIDPQPMLESMSPQLSMPSFSADLL